VRSVGRSMLLEMKKEKDEASRTKDCIAKGCMTLLQNSIVQKRGICHRMWRLRNMANRCQVSHEGRRRNSGRRRWSYQTRTVNHLRIIRQRKGERTRTTDTISS
jgi:hypothetical protein